MAADTSSDDDQIVVETLGRRSAISRGSSGDFESGAWDANSVAAKSQMSRRRGAKRLTSESAEPETPRR